MAKYKIHPIVMGTKVFDKSMMTYQYGNGEMFTIPIYCWYIEGSDQCILVDTGEMRPDQSEGRQKAIGGRIYTFEEGLAKFGKRPEGVDIIIHTHLHNDHCENDEKCTNAKIYVHQKEMEHINNPLPLDYRYNDDYIYEVEERGQIIELEGDAEIVPGITVKHTPAHTEGGLSVFIETEKGKVAITGFCIINENLNPPNQIKAMEMEVIPPGTHVNVNEAYEILEQIKREADLILPLHEPEFATGKVIG